MLRLVTVFGSSTCTFKGYDMVFDHAERIKDNCGLRQGGI